MDISDEFYNFFLTVISDVDLKESDSSSLIILWRLIFYYCKWWNRVIC